MNRSWKNRTIEREIQDYDLTQCRVVIVELLEENRRLINKFKIIEFGVRDLITKSKNA